MIENSMTRLRRWIVDRGDRKNDEHVRRLQSVPGVGPVTALAFTSTMDNINRFQTAGQVTAYLGLVPGK